MVIVKWLLIFCFFLELQAQTASELELMRPHLMSEEHPIKSNLDKIFTRQNPLKDLDSLKRAGFKFSLRKNRFMIVARHKELPGYLCKLYLDNQPLREGAWMQWIRRCQGASVIRASIESHGYHELLTVPQKWIYEIPNKRYILVVEKMPIVSQGKNLAKYRFMMHEPLLEALFTVIKENRLFDSLYLDNIPFCKDHRVAFIDTEHFHSDLKPVPFGQLLPRLSPTMQKKWRDLIN